MTLAFTTACMTAHVHQSCTLAQLSTYRFVKEDLRTQSMVPFERAFSFLVVGSSFVTGVAVIAEHSFLCSVHVVLLHLFCSITSASERNNKNYIQQKNK